MEVRGSEFRFSSSIFMTYSYGDNSNLGDVGKGSSEQGSYGDLDRSMISGFD